MNIIDENLTHKLPSNIIINILKMIPRDSQMKSPTAVIMQEHINSIDYLAGYECHSLANWARLRLVPIRETLFTLRGYGFKRNEVMESLRDQTDIMIVCNNILNNHDISNLYDE